jgi:GMP synthase-like glutamine amidotransferase
MRIQVLQHVPFEGPAGIANWASARGHLLTSVPLYDGTAPPDPADHEWLVVMGGPMSVRDESDFGWLSLEKAAIRASIDAGRTVVGICLGAQLIAEILGARVYPNREKEIGWMPIELTEAARVSDLFGFLPPRLEVFQWHGETFDLPEGCVHLARSKTCKNQAFVYDGRVLGLQFHLESMRRSVADIVRECAGEIVPAAYVQTAERMLAASPEDYDRINQALFGILDRLPQ